MIRYVYVAGPYSKPTPTHNTNRAVKAADELLSYNFVPLIPHLTHFWDTMSPKPYEVWLAYDMAWIDRCDVLLRLPGESSGADREVAYARHARPKEIPVVYSLQELLELRDKLAPGQSEP